MTCLAKQDDDRRGFRFEMEEGEGKGKGFRVTVNEMQFSLPEQTLLLSGLVLVGVAAIIGEIPHSLATSLVTNMGIERSGSMPACRMGAISGWWLHGGVY